MPTFLEVAEQDGPLDPAETEEEEEEKGAVPPPRARDMVASY